MAEEQTPNAKALSYLREVINDDEKFEQLNSGESIQVIGSEGGKYVLYPNGHVVRLDKNAPKLGKMLENDIMPYPDVLATAYTWITHDEKRFLDNWGCGNITVTNPNAEVEPDHIDEEAREDIIQPELTTTYHYVERDEDSLGGFKLLAGAIIAVVMSAILIMLGAEILKINGSSLALPTVTPSPTPMATPMPSDIVTSLAFVAPLFVAGFLIVFVVIVSMKMLE